MKAAVVSSFTSPLEILQRDIPAPDPGQVLVRLETCGLCHTDIHAAHGDWPVKPGLPSVPGHEGVGIVERVGAGVENRSVGDRTQYDGLASLPVWSGSGCRGSARRRTTREPRCAVPRACSRRGAARR